MSHVAIAMSHVAIAQWKVFLALAIALGLAVAHCMFHAMAMVALLVVAFLSILEALD